VPGPHLAGLIGLVASCLPHISSAQRLPVERIITIVAYFRAQVVKFIFGGRNSGQKRAEYSGKDQPW
jgi:hypothetical protein